MNTPPDATTLTIDLPPCPPTPGSTMVVPHLSSSHLTEDDWELLSTDTGPLILGELNTECGFLFLIEDFGGDGDEDYRACSDAFRALVAHVVDRGYAYLRLSHEGDCLTGFPTFDW